MSNIDISNLADWEKDDIDILWWFFHQSEDIEPDREDIAEALTKTFKRIGQPLNKIPRRIGYGDWAEVYWLSDRKKVLKLTTDDTDAKAMAYFKKHPSKGVVKVYDVFKIPHTKLYGILEEKLVAATGKEVQEWSLITRQLPFFVRGTGFSLTMKWFHKFQGKLQESTAEDFARDNSEAQEQLSHLLTSRPDVIATIKDWCETLDKAGMRWADLHPRNIMFRGRQAVLMDLGRNVGASGPVPVLAGILVGR